jgi:TetR/AcrR family transcriptional repressor of nem operon
LLDCAEDAARSRGFDGFSYADLSAVVGIRKASVHHHFPTKADLALAMIERYTANFFATLDAIARDHGEAGQQLRRYVAACRLASDGGEKLCLCVAFSAGREGLSEPVLQCLDAFHGKVTAWLDAVFALGKTDGTIRSVSEPLAEAQACLALMEGAQLIARAAKDAAPFDAAVSLLLARIG